MNNRESLKEFFGDFRVHLMTGISYMMPAIIVFALFMVLSQIPGSTQGMMGALSEYAQMLIVPVMTTFIAFSIAGKLSIVPSLVVGLMADQMGMGFIGGLIIGLMIGYTVKLIVVLVNKTGGGQVIDILASFLFIPIVVTF
ncbi:MAG: hypothetical protein JXA25_19755, partial [Anaerolineales bacterium]|nr:hypothetical protein [Anaerolineales bacterium]